MRAAALTAALLGLAACATLPNASLRVKGAPSDAAVTIDEQYIGVFGYVAAKGVSLPAGKHRITVEKAGYFPWDRLVESRGERIQLDVAMTPIPD